MFYVCVDKELPLAMLFKIEGENVSHLKLVMKEKDDLSTVWLDCKNFDEEHFGSMVLFHKGDNEEQAILFLQEAEEYVYAMTGLARAIKNMKLLSNRGYGMCTDYCKSIGRMTNSLYDTFMKGKERFWDVK